MNTRQLLILLCLCLNQHAAFAQDGWDLEMETEEGIQVFTKLEEGQELKSVRINFSIDSKLHPLVCMITDPDNYTKWVYNSIQYEQIEGLEPGNGSFYGRVDFPWPLTDRDFVIETKTAQCPITKTVTIESWNNETIAHPEAKGFVRIPRHFNRWSLTPNFDGSVNCEYYLKSDPGGSLPDWAINMMIHEGSVKTIQNLLTQIQEYEANHSLSFIQEK